MRELLTVLALALTLSVGSAGAAAAAADDEAPCIGENASAFAPVQRRGFGQVIVAPEARAGETGGVASGAARSECR